MKTAKLEALYYRFQNKSYVVHSNTVVLFFLIIFVVALITCGMFMFGPCFGMQYVIVLRKELVTCLNCLPMTKMLFALLMVSWLGLQSVKVVFHGHTHLPVGFYFTRL